MRLNFKDFLLNENKVYLSEKIGDVLSSIKELHSHSKVIGTRELTRFTEQIVDKIRTILRGGWGREDVDNLKVLQQVAVALMHGIDKKSNLVETLGQCEAALEELSEKMGSPIQKLVNTSEEDPKKSNNLAPAMKSGVNAQNSEPKGVASSSPNVLANAPTDNSITGPPVLQNIV